MNFITTKIEVITIITSNLKIMMVLDEFNLGGMETYVLNLTNSLLSMGHHVVIIGRKGIFLNEFKKLNCPIYTIDFPKYFHVKPADSEQFYKRIRNIVEEEEINIINFHDILPVEFVRNSIAGLTIPTFLTVHGLYFPNNQLIAAARKCDQVISVSKPVQLHLSKQNISSVLITNGINFGEFFHEPDARFRKDLNIPPDANIILYAGRLAYNKAIVCRNLLEACRDIREKENLNIHVVVIGSGLKQAELQQFANALNKTSNTKFIHMLGKQFNLRNYYSNCDGVVGTGRVAIEALACERPVIAVGSFGHVGLIGPSSFDEALNYYFGDHLSAKEYSKELLIEDIKKLLNIPDPTEWGRNGRLWAKEHFDLNRISLQVAEAFASSGNRKNNLEDKNGEPF